MRIKQFKRYIAAMLAITTVLAFTACAGNDNETSEEAASGEQMTSETNAAPAESTPDVSTDAVMKEDLTFPIGQTLNSGSFTGTAYLAPMIANEDIYNFPQTNNVTFEPGARSGWHSHGGSADTGFAHIAVNTNPERPGVEWFDRISEEEYETIGHPGQ